MYDNCVKDCEICGGVGWVKKNPDATIYDADFGKIVRCPNSRYYDPHMGISAEEARTLDWNKYIQTNAIKKMRPAYNDVLERGYGWIYVYGQPGTGKSIMAKSATVYASAVLKKASRYTRLSALINKFRSVYDGDNGQTSYKSMLRELAQLEYLAIDEIGRDRQTDFGKQTLSEIIDNRYQNAIAKQGITIWISNYAPEEVFESYQIDRIRDGRFSVINVAGSSIRPVMEWNNDNDNVWWWQE